MCYWAVLTVINSLDTGKRAERGLTRLGYEFYNPRTEERWVCRGKEIIRSIQLFPGYIFVQILGQWNALLTSIDVIGIIKDSSGPLKVPDKLIELLRTDEANGAFRLPEPGERFKQGEAVRMLDQAGSFANKFARFDGMRGPERCAILLNMLGKQVRMTVPVDALAAVEFSHATV